MKKIILTAVSSLIIGTAFASVGIQKDGVDVGAATNINITNSSGVVLTGDTANINSSPTIITQLGNNIGINTVSPSSTLEVNGIIYSNGYAGELLDRNYAMAIPSPTDINNTSVEVNSMLKYKGNLLLGYSTQGAAGTSTSVYSWNGYTLKKLGQMVTPSATIEGVLGLISYKGNLYGGILGTASGDGDVFTSSDDGLTWTKSFDSASDKFAWCSAVFNGKLYFGHGYSASRISVFDGTSWSYSYSGLSGAGLVLWMKVYKGRLFAALGSSGGATTSAIISTGDGVTWNTEYSVASSTYNQINYLEEFNGFLYATTSKGGSGTNDILVRNDTSKTWSVAISTISTDANFCNPMLQYHNTLYIGCTGNASGKNLVFKTYDGVNFILDAQFTTNGDNEVFRMIEYNGALYIGSGFLTNQGHVYKLPLSVGDSVSNIDAYINTMSFIRSGGNSVDSDKTNIRQTAPISFSSTIEIDNSLYIVDPSIYNGSQSLFITDRNSKPVFTVLNSPGSESGQAGLIGIGTVAPTTPLDVRGNVRIFGAGNPALTFGTDFKDFIVPSAQTTPDLTFWANSKKLTIPYVTGVAAYFQSGSVGVNATSPRATFEVTGSMTITGDSTLSGSVFLKKNATAIGKASCVTTNGAMGYVTSVVAADGTCTCVAY